jgi:2,4-dienoyl-CoA reductase-like NADH-dependent reductase (Old Yellow Enzyme family)
MSAMLDKCFSPAQLNGITLKNRIIKAATFEGKTPGGLPGERLRDFHVRVAQGDTAMTTIGYCAAEADGRINERMMYMDEYNRPQLQALIEDIQQAGSLVSGQLSHCGNFSGNKEFTGKRPMGPSRGINMLGLVKGLPFAGEMSHADIDRRVQVFARAAVYMKSVGFDAIEIHFGHGYGISQFISPKTNHRTDEYGGSLENRMRLPLRILEAVRKAVGDEYPILGKISMSDGVRGGVTYEESVEIASMLDKGGIDAIICSGGTSSMNPMLLFRGDSIVKGMIEQEKNILMKIGLKLMGPKLFKVYPYEEMYFLEHAKKIRDRVKCQVVYIGGVCTNDSIEQVMSAGFDFIQIGRGLLYDPDFVKNAMAQADYRNGCTHCNKCAALIDHPDGIRCVLNNHFA